MKWFFFCSIVLQVLLCCAAHHEYNDYVITMPKAFTNAFEHVCLTWLNQTTMPKDQAMNLTIIEYKTNRVFVQQSLQITSDVSCMQIETAMIKAPFARAQIKVGSVVDKQIEVSIHSPVNLVVIESSKPWYRPGELLQFRVFTLDTELKPTDQRLRRLSIRNPHGFVVKEWQNVRSQTGLIELNLPLHMEANLGQWKIVAISENNLELTKVIEVRNEVRPQFNIEVKKPKYVVKDDKEIEFEICAYDQHRFPVQGKLNVTLGYKPTQYEHGNSIISVQLPNYTFNQSINGCAQFKVDSDKIQLSQQFNYLLIVEAKVEQERSLIHQHLIQELPITGNKLIFTLPSVRMGKSYFKPQIPFKGYLYVEKPDLSKVANEMIHVCHEGRVEAWKKDDQAVQCKEYQSNQDGLVEYEIPAQTEQVKQLFVSVSAPAVSKSEHKSFVIRPFYQGHHYVNQTADKAPANESVPQQLQLFLQPSIERTDCSQDHQMIITTYNLREPVRAYYQVIGKHMEQPHSFELNPSQGKPIDDQTHEFLLTVKSEHLKSKALPAARVLVFTHQPGVGVIADYDSFAINCQQAELNATVVSSMVENQAIPVQIAQKPADARCVYTISKDRSEYELVQKKLNRFMEKLDANVEMFLAERCNSKSQQQVPIVSYRSSWHSFERAGVLAITENSMDMAPCDSELYPNGVSKEQSELMESELPYFLQQRNYLINEQTEVAKLERKIQGKFIGWSQESSFPPENVSQRHHWTVEQHLSGVCLSPAQGIFYVHAQHYPHSQIPFTAIWDGPSTLKQGETGQFRLMLEQSDQFNQSSFAVQFDVQPINNQQVKVNASYEQEVSQCFTGKQIFFHMNVTALQQSTTDAQFKIIVKPMDSLQGCSIQHPKAHFVEQNLMIKFAIQPAHHVEVRNTEVQVFCNDQTNPKVAVEIRPFNGVQFNRTVKYEDLLISANPMDVFLPSTFDRISAEDRLQYKSPTELVSYLSALIYANRTQPATAVTIEQQTRLINEILRGHQILDSKRLNIGLYSWFVGKSAALPFVDLPLTVSIFKLYRQPEMRSITPANPIAIRQTLMSLLQAQHQDGHFEVNQMGLVQRHPHMNHSDVSAYMLVQFADAGLRTTFPAVRRLISYQKNQTDQLSLAALAFAYATEHNVDQANAYVSKFVRPEQMITAENVQDFNSTHRLIVAIQALALHSLNRTEEAAAVVKHLFVQHPNQEPIFADQLEAQAVMQLWPQFVQNSYIQITDQKATIQGAGCAMLRVREVISFDQDMQQQFKLTVTGTERGFRTCEQRALHICYRSKQSQIVQAPMLNVELPTGFGVDQWLLTDMLNYGSASQLDSFELRSHHVHLLLKPLKPTEAYCIDLPLVQQQVVDQRSAYAVQLFDYERLQYVDEHHVHPIDTVFYTLPDQCQVIQQNLHSIRPTPVHETAEPLLSRGKRSVGSSSDDGKSNSTAPKQDDNSVSKSNEELKKRNPYEQDSYGQGQSYGTSSSSSYDSKNYQQKSYDQPKQSYHHHQPAPPAYQPPTQPSYNQPQIPQQPYKQPQSYQQPPKQSYGSSQSYSQPPQTYSQPPPTSSYSQGYQPQNSYQATNPYQPQNSYSQPQPYQQQPQQAYQQQNQPQTYQQPQSYAQPPSYQQSQSYSPPQTYQPQQNQTYSQPQSYEQPKSSYGYDSYSYEQPQQSYGYQQPQTYGSQQQSPPQSSYGYQQPQPQPQPQPQQPSNSYQQPQPQPSYGYQQPQQPSNSYQQPPQQPSYGYQQPPQQPQQPSYGYQQPSPQPPQQPSYGYQQPQPSPQPPQQPSYGYQQPQPSPQPPQQPSYGYQQPQPQPSYGHQQPSQPSYGHQQPPTNSYDQPQQSYGYQQPPQQPAQPSYNYQQSYEQPQQSYGYQPPQQSYEPQPYQQPQYGQQQYVAPEEPKYADYQQPSAGGYKRSIGSDLLAGIQSPSYQHTQPEYAYPQYQQYQSPPGYLRTGYWNSQSSPNENYNVNPNYYYQPPTGYNGAQYKPAPVVVSPTYQPYQHQPPPTPPSYGFSNYSGPQDVNHGHSSYEQPAYGGQPQQPPPYGSSQPGTHVQPSYGSNSQPQYGQQPPQYGQQPPQYGQQPQPQPQPPQYGQQSSYGSQPPQYGQPPSYESQQSTYQTTGYGSQAQSYAVMFTPVKYATAYVPSYVPPTNPTGGYGNSNSGLAGFTNSGASLYAASSDEFSSVVEAPLNQTESCPSIESESCPVCSSVLPIEVIANACEYNATVFKLPTESMQESIDSKAICKHILYEHPLTENVKPDPEWVVKSKNCVCDELTNDAQVNNQVIILYHKEHVNGNRLMSNSNMYIVKKTHMALEDFMSVQRQC